MDKGRRDGELGGKEILGRERRVEWRARGVGSEFWVLSSQGWGNLGEFWEIGRAHV